jgi:hypothetical protein
MKVGNGLTLPTYYILLMRQDIKTRSAAIKQRMASNESNPIKRMEENNGRAGL